VVQPDRGVKLRRLRIKKDNEERRLAAEGLEQALLAELQQAEHKWDACDETS
jgi:hypothetical protein